MLTVRDIKDLAEANWGRYLRIRDYKNNNGWMYGGFILFGAFMIFALISALTTATPAPQEVALNGQVVVPAAGKLNIVAYTDLQFMVYQDGAVLPMIAQPVEKPNRASHVLGSAAVIAMLLSATFLIVWTAGFIQDRSAFVTHSIQKWLDSDRKELPSAESVTSFTKSLTPSKGVLKNEPAATTR
jgi:hypothetical protein